MRSPEHDRAAEVPAQKLGVGWSTPQLEADRRDETGGTLSRQLEERRHHCIDEQPRHVAGSLQPAVADDGFAVVDLHLDSFGAR